jgi:hypothetical protein
MFIKAAQDQKPTIKPEQFRKRFREFLQELEQPEPSAEILKKLFDLAVQAQKGFTNRDIRCTLCGKPAAVLGASDNGDRCA